jgi:methyl-accepting chemotaxis protein
MIGLLKRSFLAKMLVTSTMNIILVGITLIGCSYFIQGKVLETQLDNQASKIMEGTSDELDQYRIEEVMKDNDSSSSLHKRLRSFFDNVSANNPQVAQAYIFGTELKDGNQTSIVSMPTAVLEAFNEADLHLGDFYEQPQVIVDTIKHMVANKDIVYSKVYNDDYGTWMSVLKPIKNTQGDIVAYYALDIDASMIVKGKQELLKYSSLALLIILGVLIAFQFYIVRKSIRPLRELGLGIDIFSQGSFDISLKEGEDEIGQINKKFNDMTARMRQIILAIKEAYGRNADYSEKILRAVKEGNHHYGSMVTELQHISDQMKNQEASTVESAASLQEIVSGITSIADYSSEVRKKADELESRSQIGNKTVHEMMEQMNLAEQSVGNSSEALQKLHQQSREISGIVNLITDIADQTNLLALNAAIEAARAGEHGKGFAVVADEVRKLAEQSRKSAEQIKDLISGIQNEVDVAVSSISVGSQKVSSSVNSSDEITQIFDQILEGINGISIQVQEISTSTQQVAAESQEVGSVVEQLSSIAKHNSAASSDITQNTEVQKNNMSLIAQDVEEMNRLFQKLQDSISIFKI